MRRIVDVADRRLKWAQPRARKKEFELRADEELAATLRFRSSFGTFATAESADGCWTFKRIGFWQSKASIRACGSEEDVALFKNSTWSAGGTLTLRDGQEFRATTNIWRTKLAFETEAGEELLRMKTSGILKRSAKVEITPVGRRVPQLPILVLFAWYLAIMLSSDSDAATVAAASG